MTGLETLLDEPSVPVFDFLGERKRIGSTFSASSSKVVALRLVGLVNAREDVRLILTN